ncbi:unnamed protein product, partial [Brenthis ino]
MPEKASQAEHNERRRATGGALAIDMASLRSVGRCEQFGALQRRMPPARVPRIPRAHHTCCVFIERHSRRCPGMQGCRLPLLSLPMYRVYIRKRPRCG